MVFQQSPGRTDRNFQLEPPLAANTPQRDLKYNCLQLPGPQSSLPRIYISKRIEDSELSDSNKYIYNWNIYNEMLQ